MTWSPRCRPKVFRRGRFVLGYCGSFRAGQAVEFGFRPPAIRDGEDVAAVIQQRVVPLLRKALEAGGVQVGGKVDEVDFIVGVEGRLFVIDNSLELTEAGDAYGRSGQERS